MQGLTKCAVFILLAGIWSATPLCAGEQSVADAGSAVELGGDRPDFTENILTVPKGGVQVELGASTARLGDSSCEHSWPEALVRIGSGPSTELRFGLPERDSFQGGIKQRLVSSAAGFDLTALGSLSFSEGNTAAPGGGIVWGRSIEGVCEVGGQFSMSYFRDEGKWLRGGQGTLVAARALSNRVGTFFEYSLEVTEREAPVHVLHHGYTWQFADLLQFDAHGGVGLSAEAPDLFVGVGLVARLNR